MSNWGLDGLLEQFWAHLSHQPLAGLVLSLLAYSLGLWLYQRAQRPVILHPVLTAAALIALALHSADINYRDYVASNQLLYLLLGPATVALAVPLHQEFHHLRGLVLPILVTIVCGAIIAVLSAVGIAWLAGASDSVLLALTPKSVTTPIALGIAERIGALGSLTAGIVVFTGVSAALLAPLVFRLTGLADERLRGLVLGLNGHGVGTAIAFERSPVSGAFASLAMGLTGALTALTLPLILRWWPFL